MIKLPTLLAICFLATFIDVEGHGRLLDPPSRASMFRMGFQNPPDYQDNQGFCGGREYQIEQGGKCGICGDPWLANPKEHEAPGGKYANGIITNTYEVGQEVEVRIQITANHLGYFQFKLCANNDVSADKDQSCFDKNFLQIVNGDDTKFYITDESKDFYPIIKLPDGLSCDQCILQWTYITGNSWGCDPITKMCGNGIGDQENFRACSDIRITSNNSTETTESPNLTTYSTSSPDKTTPNPSTTTEEPEKPIDGLNCSGTGVWRNKPEIDAWCNDNCEKGFCPPNICACN